MGEQLGLAWVVEWVGWLGGCWVVLKEMRWVAVRGVRLVVWMAGRLG